MRLAVFHQSSSTVCCIPHSPLVGAKPRIQAGNPFGPAIAGCRLTRLRCNEESWTASPTLMVLEADVGIVAYANDAQGFAATLKHR